MDCERCREVVSAGLDGEAGAGEERAAREHLDGCAACRDHAERTAAVTRMLRLGTAEAGPDLVASVVGRALGAQAARCGCDRSCGCGCQQGRRCRCRRGAA